MLFQQRVGVFVHAIKTSESKCHFREIDKISRRTQEIYRFVTRESSKDVRRIKIPKVLQRGHWKIIRHVPAIQVARSLTEVAPSPTIQGVCNSPLR